MQEVQETGIERNETGPARPSVYGSYIDPDKERDPGFFSLHLDAMGREIHYMAKEKGWWDKPRSTFSLYSLFLSEISEGVEEVRKPAFGEDVPATMNAVYYIHPRTKDPISGYKTDEEGIPLFKPEGVAIELADFVIRGLDYMAYKGLKVVEMSQDDLNNALKIIGITKEEFYQELNSFQVISELTCHARALGELESSKGKKVADPGYEESYLSLAFALCREYVEHVYAVDFIELMELKVHFNGTRSIRHGGKKY